MEFIESSISLAVQSQTKQSKRLSYGTAGFRDNHQKVPLNSVFVRMGILASFRSLSVASKPTGVMITASHNEECDNGIKIVDFDGGMLTQTWEPYAEQLANADTADDFILILKGLSDAEGITSTSFSKAPIVLFGRDTRPHSLELAQCVKRGIESCGGIALDMGEVTTPQLHFFVERLNSKSYEEQVALSAEEAAKDYFKTLSAGYQLLNVLHPLSTTPILPVGTTIVIDASSGVGSYSVDGLMGVVNTGHQQATAGEPLLTVDVRNMARSGPVNDECGAELVQKGQRPPKNVDAASDLGKLMCSFDGDADRIVFHTYLPVGDDTASASFNWLLFDGDKIAALVALLISQELRAASLDTQFALGVVQTAYANGGSTNFFRENGIPVDIAKTGVKFVHHKAKEFDIGVYFEANGHGTVLFSQRFLGVLEAWTPPELAEPALDRRDIAMHRLKACTMVINQAVGDALSDMLLCLAALRILSLDAAKWHAFYSDLPSKMIKLGVRDKSSIHCSEDETRVVEPQALQTALDAAMAAVDRGRCFVRPSGTEDVVRVYAEASTSEGVEELIAAAVDAIQRIVG